MATPTLAIDQIKQGMASTNGIFNTEVFQKRNFHALDEVYTVDARILPPGAPMISGLPAIKQFWSDMIQSANAKSAVLTSIDVMQSGDGIVEIGKAVLTVGPADQPPAEIEVKYVVFWQLDGGRWKWHVDIWNPNA
jgi:ketosteroid isomerase-like protein